MTRQLKHISDDFQNVVAGSTATYKAANAGIYFSAMLYLTDTATACTAAIMKVKYPVVSFALNGTEQFRLTMTELLDMAEELGSVFTDGYCPIDFARIHRQTMEGEDWTAWGMKDINNFDISVDIDAGATAPTIDMITEWQPGNKPSGSINTYRKIPVEVTSATEKTVKIPFSELSANNFRTIAAVRLRSTQIDWVSVFIGEKELVRRMTPADIAVFNKRRGYSPVADQITISRELLTGRFGDIFGPQVIDGVLHERLDVICSMNGTTDFTAIVEDLGPRKA